MAEETLKAPEKKEAQRQLRPEDLLIGGGSGAGNPALRPPQPKYESGIVERTREEHYFRGLAATIEGSYDEAVSFFTKSIELGKKDSDAYYNRGFAKQKMGDFKGAKADYEECVRIGDSNGMARNNMGIISEEAGDFDKALEYFNAAISADAENPAFRINKANACINLGKAEEAMKEYGEAERLDPENMDVYYNRAEAKRKIWCDKQGNIADPEKNKSILADLEKYMDLNPFDAETAANLRALKRRV
jgi:tetratricopeptide (TPR) repeat protein